VIEEPTRRVYALYGRADRLLWHENHDPGTHNYQLDNREQAYRFFGRAFGVPGMATDDPRAASELKSAEELEVGLPADNLTILGLARRLAAGLEREPLAPAAARARLRQVVRYEPAAVDAAWRVASTNERGVETASYLLRMSDGLSASAVRLAAVTAAEGAPATLVLADAGRGEAGQAAAERVNRGETVLALELAFVGAPWSERETRRLLQNLNGLGERPLGIEAAELVAAARWMAPGPASPRPRLEAQGMRSQLTALVAAALEPEVFSQVVVRGGIRSLGELLDEPVEYLDAPDLFCLDLYREFDVGTLEALGPASPRR